MKKTLIVFASILLLSGACWSDDLEANADEAKYYDNAKVVRIKSIEGEGYVRRSYEEGDEEAVPNLPLFEKDTIGTTDGRLAIYLGRMNYLRLDGDTVAVLEKLPPLRTTELAVRLEAGSIYLEVESLDREKGIEVQTPDCGVFFLDKGAVRVNVTENGATEVIVYEGIAEVSGRDNSRNVRENQKIVMVRGEVEERPYYFTASEKDDFDRWNEAQDRDLDYARYGTSRYLQGGYEDYEYELSRAGRWSYMSEFSSYVWSPYDAGGDWMPYANGRWVWNPYYGYVWTSYDSCGWFTHHYGRWHWDYALGWYWIPSYHWSPAWVSWFGNDNYYGWCPLSWWNRPVFVINNRWDRYYDHHRGIPRHSRSTIIIRKNELAAPNIHRAIVSRGSLGQDQDVGIAFRGKAPAERPVINKVTVINARGKSMTYKQGAVVSSEKYRAQGSDIRDAVYKYDAGPGGSVIRSKASEANSGTTVRSKSSGSSPYRSTDAATSSEGSSGNTVYRSRAKKSESDSAAGNSTYRSKSGSSTSSSSSSSSSDSSGTARKKKKGESAYFSNPNGGGSITASGRSAAAVRNRSRNEAFATRYVSRSYGPAEISQDSASSYSASASSRRVPGSFRYNPSGEEAAADSAYRSPASSRYGSLDRGYRSESYSGSTAGYSAGSRSSATYSGSSRSNSSGSRSSYSGSSHANSAGSRSSYSGRSSHSSSSSSGSSHRASSSSSSSGSSSSSRAKKN